MCLLASVGAKHSPPPPLSVLTSTCQMTAGDGDRLCIVSTNNAGVGMQAALQEAHDQKQRLTLTVSAMRSDMELMQRHAASPGPQPNPTQTPPHFPPLHAQSQTLPQGNQPYEQQYAGPRQEEEGWRPSTGDQSMLQHALQSQQQQRQQQMQHDEEVQQLRQQLQDAKAEAEGLAAENERLMEMSNALRSECGRTAVSQQHQEVVAVTSLGPQGNVQQPCLSLPLSPGLQPQQVYCQAQQAYPLGPQSMSWGQAVHPQTMQWAAQGMPAQPSHGLPQQAQMPQALMPVEAQGKPGQLWQTVQQPQQAAGQFAAPSGQHQNSLATVSTADDALPHEVFWIKLGMLVLSLCLKLHHIQKYMYNTLLLQQRQDL